MTSNTTPELKPCPKCGGGAFIRQVGNEHTKKRGFDFGCKQCRITISDRVMRQSLEWLLPKSIATWNTRASPEVVNHDVDCGVGIGVGCTCNGEQAKARIEELEAQHEWKDISTAPRDGAKIDLWAVNRYQEVGARFCNCLWGRKLSYPSDMKDHWLGLPQDPMKWEPTHWRYPPPPPPPKTPTNA